MLDGYIPLLIIIVVLPLALIFGFKILPALGANRYGDNKISLRTEDILKKAAYEDTPPGEDQRYLEPYESGEVAREIWGRPSINQYYIVVLLFVVFDVDMLLLFPWAYDFKSLGLIPFIETLIFLAMPLFAVYYAFKLGYMRWLK
ncbi:NADH dehydrogenase I chain A [Thermoplasma volcanium GSS1]|uniref:NADH dehydrogenase I chain A n=1 Tax=Thermoplasma volcanium (strain ATCC 51530 / DSM 4299 / JCM 9571 / NBRC 15438 / GSS1) TaxID=273116 RepID=Q979M0_THEVO|nr:NADH-quinone oxidoreductase subunit A [Thermoplasma volcanium]BAB60282.1 NADH dehydrogenase I chain A [Thermoplasma volcanium GSS1]